MNALKVEHVSKSYGDFTALDDISLSIAPECIFGLLGPNGAGKTSLIRIVNQIIAPDSGEVEFFGQPMQEDHISQIGYLPEERGLYPKMKVGEQLVYLARLKGLSKEVARSRTQKWLREFELLNWQDKEVEELSKGMAQKVQFIATVIHEPKLLILDEPFTGFDPVNTEMIKAKILELRAKGATVIFSTHRMDSVEELCDEIVLIDRGKKVLEGSIRAIKEQHRKHEYRVEILNAQIPDSFASGELLDHSEKDGISRLLFRSDSDDAQALLNELMGIGQIRSFKEELPSLNEIFINQVKGR